MFFFEDIFNAQFERRVSSLFGVLRPQTELLGVACHDIQQRESLDALSFCNVVSMAKKVS